MGLVRIRFRLGRSACYDDPGQVLELTILNTPARLTF